METEGGSSTVEELEQKVARAEHVKEIINRIHSAKDLDHIVVDLRDEILQVLDAELLTLYVVDAERREIYSKFLDINKIREIRVPISEQSIAGFVAKFRRPVNIADAYSRAELRAISPALTFDSSWDRKSGSRTKQILTFPIVADGKYLMGVIQLVNKKSGGRFTQKDEDAVAELAKTLGIAFFNRLKVSRRIPTKFDYLVAHNRITQADLEQAIREAQQGQLDVETVLLEQYQVPRADIGKSLSQFYRCPFIEYDGADEPRSGHCSDSVNPETLRSNAWIPLKHDKDGVHILSDDPNQPESYPGDQADLPRPAHPVRRRPARGYPAIPRRGDRPRRSRPWRCVRRGHAESVRRCRGTGFRRDRVARLRTGRRRDGE